MLSDEERMAQIAKATAGFAGLDDLEPKGPAGHARGVATATMLTSDYRKRLRRGIVDVKPDEVMDCLRDAGVEGWVLMGLHGYVGYLPMPRATQDVDVMVPLKHKSRAARALADRWPMLERQDRSVVIRFVDPTDRMPDGTPKPMIDLMLPGEPYQQEILKQHIRVDPESGNRYPTLEAALVSKYSALVSPFRSRDKKEYDAGDFRRIVRANASTIDREILATLAGMIWDGGHEDVLRFVDLTLDDQPLPI